jgi:predicted phage terminase large subunit-like protein
MTAAAAVEAARASPAAFLALALGKPVADLQREMLHHALTHLSWYAEIPRGHTKTSTFAYAVAWWLGVRPDTRMKIVSQTDDHAAPTSRFIREIVRAPAFRATFPHVTLKPGEDTVTSWSVTAPGLGTRRDPSVAASGVFGRTGGRADVIWFDDICDLRNAVLQPTMRGQVKEAVSNVWMPMLDPAADHDNRVWRTATPFHTDDITADWRRIHAEDGSLFRKPCIGLQSPWAEVFTPEVLEERRRALGPMAYARAYELVPLSSDLLVFRPEWFGYYRADAAPKVSRTIAAIDWGYGRKAQERDDPDYSVCIVGQVDSERRLHLTDCLRVREAFPEFARMAAALLERRGASVVLAEANGPQRGIFDQFQTMTSLPLVAVERVADKHLRAAGAQPFVAGGKLLFPTDADGKALPAFQPVLDELTAFPAGAHDDTVDCIVDMCTEAVRGSLTRADRDVKRIGGRQDAISRMFSVSTPRKPFFG